MSNKINTADFLRGQDFHVKKKYGQNFLTDKSILPRIVEESGVSEEDTVLEIGPGTRNLTSLLADKARNVIAVEIDKDLIPILRISLFPRKNVSLYNIDIMKADIHDILCGKYKNEYFEEDHFYSEKEGEEKDEEVEIETCLQEKKIHTHEEVPHEIPNSIRVVANLPYYITTPVITKLLSESHYFKSITVMVQKEVAERLVALPGRKEYGAITLFSNYYSTPEILFDVPRESFYPSPKVESAIIRFDILETPKVQCKDEKIMFDIIRASFNERRKTLSNAVNDARNLNFTKEKVNKTLEKMGLQSTIRGERLTLSDFAKFTDLLLEEN